eukprot:356191-Chlamydomonas_euryale.AAC.13
MERSAQARRTKLDFDHLSRLVSVPRFNLAAASSWELLVVYTLCPHFQVRAVRAVPLPTSGLEYSPEHPASPKAFRARRSVSAVHFLPDQGESLRSPRAHARAVRATGPCGLGSPAATLPACARSQA